MCFVVYMLCVVLPVAILSAVFCVICSLLMSVSEASGYKNRILTLITSIIVVESLGNLRSRACISRTSGNFIPTNSGFL